MALTRSSPRLSKSIIAALNSRSPRGHRVHVNRLWRTHAELHVEPLEAVQERPSLRRLSYQFFIMPELKLSRSPRADFACLIIRLFCHSEMTREGGIFPSISVKIDSGEARKRRLPCGESQSRRQLPTSRTSSRLPSAHLACLLQMFAYHRYAAEASHGGRIFPSIHSNCSGSR